MATRAWMSRRTRRALPEMFVESRPDLVLLDLHMPGMDGFELMEQLGPLTGRRRRVPFLVLTADATEETKRRALSMGARDFLTKPLDRIELLLRVRNLLQVKQLQDRLREHNAQLEHEVAERTRDLDQARVRDPRAPCARGRVPRRRHAGARLADRPQLRADRPLARAARGGGRADRARRPASRHRQDRYLRRDPAQARQADRRGVRADQGAHHGSAPRSSPAAGARCCDSPSRSR